MDIFSAMDLPQSNHRGNVSVSTNPEQNRKYVAGRRTNQWSGLAGEAELAPDSQI